MQVDAPTRCQVRRRQLELVVVGGKTYAKVPKSLNSTGKPYVLVIEPSSKNAQYASSLTDRLSLSAR